LYSISALDGSNKIKISTKEGWYSASFMDDAMYYVLSFFGV